jgi:WD40 repeat protein
MSSRWLVAGGLAVLLAVPAQAAAEERLPAGALARLTPPRRAGAAGLDAIAVSPDGKSLATVGGLGGVRVWRLGALGDGPVAEEEAALAVAYSPDGKLVAAATRNNGVALWDADLDRKREPLGGHKGGATALAFAADGRLLASGGVDGTVRLWDLSRASEKRRLDGHDGLVTAVAFGPEGKTVISASLDRTVRVWDAATGKELRRLDGHRDRVLAVRTLADGSVATASLDHTLRLWDPATGKELRTFEGHAHGVTSVDASADGGRLVSGGLDGTVRVWDAATGKQLLEVAACDAGVAAVAFTPDGKSVIDGDRDGAVRRWDAATGKELERFGLLRADLNRDGIPCLDWSPDGKRLVTGSEEGVRVWDAATGKMVRLLGRLADAAWGVAWSPDGKQVVAVGRRDGTVHAWDPDTGEELFRYGPAHKGGISRVAFSPDGRRLASGGGTFDPTIHVWDAHTGKHLRALEAPMQYLEGLAWSPDGKRLASVGWDKLLRVWDADAGKELRQFPGPGGYRAVAWSADGRWLATAGDGHAATLWDPAGEREPVPLGTGEQAAGMVVFAPDGRTLAAGGGKGVGLWETATGRPRTSFAAGTGDAAGAGEVALRFSPDGRRVAADANGVVLIWDVTGLAGRPAKEPTAEEVGTLWDQLGGEGEAAHAAVWRLVAAPKQAVPVLRERLRPAAAADPAKVARWVKDLDDDSFAVRERASRELGQLGELVEGALVEAAKPGNSAEVRTRARALLARLREPGAPDRLRQLRALEVLEQAATADARDLLRELAKGAPQAWVTQDAAAALKRLDRP